jgi:hypothetical protein
VIARAKGTRQSSHFGSYVAKGDGEAPSGPIWLQDRLRELVIDDAWAMYLRLEVAVNDRGE